MKTFIYGILIFGRSAFLSAGDPVVENVRFEQRTDGSLLVDIHYDVLDEDGDLLDIRIEASDDHGATWTLPCASLTGDVGEGITPGVDKHVIWDFHADNPGVSGDGYRVRVMARDIVIDIDGNVYDIVSIGDQDWLVQNLKVTRYRNGEEIPEVTDDTAWTELSTGARCAYANDENNAETYGYLYNWYAVDDVRNIAPEGWRVPSDADWKELEMALGMSQSQADSLGWRGTHEGSKLACNASLWDSGMLKNHADFGTSGFSALPAGYRNYDGDFGLLGTNAYFWSATERNADRAWTRRLRCSYSAVYRRNYDKLDGFSLRLIKGESTDEHIVSKPDVPSGPDAGETAEDLVFTASGSVCSEGHNVKYRFDWGDDTYSAWGDATRNISYSDTGTYEIRSQARCAADTSIISEWSDEKSVTVRSAFETGTMTGNDGRVYRTVKIGDQWWMMENLRETQYRNGDAIPEVTDNTAWSELSAGARCVYDNDVNNADTYGYLYNWYAVDDAGNIAPEGWRVPTDDDWKELEMALGMSESDADVSGWRGSPVGSKIAGNADIWDSGALKNHAEFGTSGFSALPAGYRCDYQGNFYNLGGAADFWSATEDDASFSWRRHLGCNDSDVYRYNGYKQNGFSLRLIRE